MYGTDKISSEKITDYQTDILSASKEKKHLLLRNDNNDGMPDKQYKKMRD